MKRLVTLTEPQRAELVARYKTEKNVHLRDRLHCVLLKADGRTNQETAQILLTSAHTVNDWLDRYDAGGLETLCAWEVGGSDLHLTKEQIQQKNRSNNSRQNLTQTATRTPNKSVPG